MITQRRRGIVQSEEQPITIFVPKQEVEVYGFKYTGEKTLIFKPCRNYE